MASAIESIAFDRVLGGFLRSWRGEPDDAIERLARAISPIGSPTGRSRHVRWRPAKRRAAGMTESTWHLWPHGPRSTVALALVVESHGCEVVGALRFSRACP